MSAAEKSPERIVIRCVFAYAIYAVVTLLYLHMLCLLVLKHECSVCAMYKAFVPVSFDSEACSL